MQITKENLISELEHLDEHYLELVYRILRQFPHSSEFHAKSTSRDPLRCSRQIYYESSDDSFDGAKPFAHVRDAAEYGKTLRAQAWRRGTHG